MTKIALLDEIFKLIEALRIAYPEKDRLIDEIYECVNYDVYDSTDALVYKHMVNDVMVKMFDEIEFENFDERDLSDMEYAEIITDIKHIAEILDSLIADYVEYLMDEYHFYD